MRRLTSRLGIGYGEVSTCVTGPVKSIILVVLLICLLALTALGQTTRGSLSGSVSDPTGSSVAGATVTLKNNATGAESKATTGGQGTFVFPSVEPGEYLVTVEATGFKRVVATNVVVNVSKQAQVTIALEIGAVNETVTVTSGVQDIINTTSPTLTNVIDTRQVRDLPLAFRNPLDLAGLQPGIAVTGTDVRGSSVAGLRQTATNVTHDGINAMDNFVKTSSFFDIAAPSLNSTSEFSITTGTGSSESGRGVGHVNIRTTTGTNDFHGSGYYQIRRDRFEANSWINNSTNIVRPLEKQDFFGFAAGGPVVLPRFGEGGKHFWNFRDKSFWFLSYEGFREDFQVTRNRTVLTPEARTGIFRYTGSNGVIQSVNLLAIGNVNTLNPLTTAQLNAMPLPNNTLLGDALNTGGARFNVIGSAPNDKVVARYDQVLVEKSKLGSHKLEFVFNRGKFILFPDTFNGIEAPFRGGIDAGQASTRWLMTIADHSTFGNVTNELRWGRQWAPVKFLRASQPTAPFISFGSVTNFDNTFMSQGRETIVNQLIDNVAVPKGSHTLRFGADYQQIFADTFNDAGINKTIFLGTNSSNPNGIVNSQFPNLPAGSAGTTIVNRALSIYNDLTGFLGSASATFNVTSPTSGFVQGVTRSRIFRTRDLAFYGQDQWRWRHNVTLNYGVRWEFVGVPTIPNGLAIQLTNVNDLFGVSGPGNLFNPNAAPGAAPAKATLDFVSGKTGKGLYKNDWNNFAPFFGFAYSPDFKSGILHRLLGSEGTSSFRGGYSISYLHDGFTVISNALGTGNTNPGLIQTAANTIPTGVLTGAGVPLTTPTFVMPVTDRANNLINPNNGLWAIRPDLATPYVQQWSFGYEREITRNMAFEIRYVANHAVKVLRAEDFNEVNIFENGFLQEFLNAQKNLAINGGTSFAPGAAGTVPLPILSRFFTGLASGNGFASSGFISNLNNNNVGIFASTLAFSNTYRANRENPALGIPANFFVANPNAAFIRLLDNSSMSNYNSLQIEVRRRLSHGLQFQADYTFSKALTDARDAYGNNQSDLVSFRTLRNRSLDYARSNQDQTHRFVANAIYDLPFGSGRRFLSNANGLVNRIVGGWTIGNIVAWQSRPPFYITANRSTFNAFCPNPAVCPTTYASNNPAQLVGITFAEFKKNLGVFRHPTGLYFVNPALLTIVTNPVTGQVSSSLNPGLMAAPAPGGFGNFPINSLNGPSYFNTDISIVKRIPITERVKFQIKATMLNALNHANFVFGNQTFDSTTFGKITTQSGTPRVIHFLFNVSW